MIEVFSAIVKSRKVECLEILAGECEYYFDVIEKSGILETQFGKMITLEEFRYYMEHMYQMYAFSVDGDIKLFIYMTLVDRDTVIAHICPMGAERLIVSGYKLFINALPYKNYFAIYDKRNIFIERLTDLINFKDRIELKDYSDGKDFVFKRYQKGD